MITARSAATRDSWWAELEDMLGRFAGRFSRVEPRRRAAEYVRGLLAPEARKTGSGLASAAGHATADGMHKLLNSSRWDADAVRDDLRGYAVEHLGSSDAVLVLREMSFAKKGTRSVGVQRQPSPATGRTENCQIGIFLTYASARGTTVLDRELFLPRSWADDPDRRAAAAVPAGRTYATRTQLAETMVERALASKVPFAWVTGDENHVRDPGFRQWLEARRIPYLLTTPRPRTAATRLRADNREWVVLARHRSQYPGWERWMLAHHPHSRPEEVSCYLGFCPAGTSLAELIRVAAVRDDVHTRLRAGAGEVGLDDYEVRQYHAWYRHMTLVMAAYSFLAAVADANPM
ncbi:IS701 family transposase [Longispora sp. K20-0274]|uniref:IS701 family transposase n=1 Tax=Longispora sp. K20-0274 TaxID=3088255 RepID=UPI0039994B25